jgi:ketosteroid isomerase-like protein
MKITSTISAFLLSTLALSMTVNAHDPKLHAIKTVKADCSKMEHKKMEVKSPVVKAMMKKCLKQAKHSNKAMLPAEKAIYSFHQALKQGNKKEARELLDDNVIIYEGGRVERTADEYADHHMLADMAYLAAINNETLEHNVKVAGDTAYSMSRTKSTGQFKGKTIDHESMETIILRRIAGSWKITHIHWSN